MLTAASSTSKAFKPEQLDPSWSPVVRRALLRNGYFPTPTNGKAPVLDNWPNLRATEADVAGWETALPNAKNTGILTATTPTVDIDVLDAEMAKTIHARLVAPLIPQGYPKLVRVGLAPKHAVPFRSDQPFPKIATPRYMSEDGKVHRVEVLGAGQQFIAFGIHPGTAIAGVAGHHGRRHGHRCQCSLSKLPAS